MPCCRRAKADFAFENRREFLEENGDEFLALQQALTRLGSELENLPSKPEEVFNFARRTQELQVQLGFLMESEDRNTVFWIERRRGGRDKQNVFLQATPIDVAPILKTCLFDKLECAVLTSATLAVGGSFEYMRSGWAWSTPAKLFCLRISTIENQALFYVPPDLPDPRTPQFAAKAADRIRRLLEITRGRAFVLFTSYAQMNDVYQRLLGELEFPMLLQGDAPKTALLEEFRLTPHAVLFATSSFWQGVDVQGEQLSCVIIDRLPFAVPERSGGGGAGEVHRRRRRQRLLPVSGAGGGHHAETGLRTADPLAARSRPAGAARQPHPEEAVREGVCGEPAALSQDDGH